MAMAAALAVRLRSAAIPLAAVAAWLGSPALPAQQIAGMELVQALQAGGHVVVVRNARSPEDPPEAGDRAPANLQGEREIDEYGQGQMAVLGYAFRQLGIPVGHTLTSPAYRSRQSGHYFGFGERAMADGLAENADGSWLAARIADAPESARNRVIVTHGSLIARALGQDARDLGTAETLIYRSRDGDAEFVARLTVEDWAELAVN